MVRRPLITFISTLKASVIFRRRGDDGARLDWRTKILESVCRVEILGDFDQPKSRGAPERG